MKCARLLLKTLLFVLLFRNFESYQHESQAEATLLGHKHPSEISAKQINFTQYLQLKFLFCDMSETKMKITQRSQTHIIRVFTV